MRPKTDNKIILIIRHTRLEELIDRFNTLNQAKFYIEHLGADFSDYENEHNQYKTALCLVESQLRELGRVQVLDRLFLSNFIFGKDDLVVVLGQDGLVANTLKYLDRQRVVAVNPDPGRWEGILLPFGITDVCQIVKEVFAETRLTKQITMAQVELNNGQKFYGVNDIFIGPKSHISIRYKIKIGKEEENHSSSGIIVSTGLGSTGWLKSILAGVNGISAGPGKPVDGAFINNFEWDSDYLIFSVREPWPSKFSQANLIFGKITQQKKMVLVSQMPENGVIFSDGIESDFLEFNSGTQATVSVADKKGHIVV